MVYIATYMWNSKTYYYSVSLNELQEKKILTTSCQEGVHGRPPVSVVIPHLQASTRYCSFQPAISCTIRTIIVAVKPLDCSYRRPPPLVLLPARLCDQRAEEGIRCWWKFTIKNTGNQMVPGSLYDSQRSGRDQL